MDSKHKILSVPEVSRDGPESEGTVGTVRLVENVVLTGNLIGGEETDVADRSPSGTWDC